MTSIMIGGGEVPWSMSNSKASAAMAEQVVVVVVGRQERRISFKSNNCRSWIEHVTQL